MKILVNGQATTLAGDITLATLIEHYQLQPAHIISEVNGTIIQAEHRAHTPLQANDQIELIRFVGGGRPPKTINQNETY